MAREIVGELIVPIRGDVKPLKQDLSTAERLVEQSGKKMEREAQSSTRRAQRQRTGFGARFREGLGAGVGRLGFGGVLTGALGITALIQLIQNRAGDNLRQQQIRSDVSRGIADQIAGIADQVDAARDPRRTPLGAIRAQTGRARNAALRQFGAQTSAAVQSQSFEASNPNAVIAAVDFLSGLGRGGRFLARGVAGAFTDASGRELDQAFARGVADPALALQANRAEFTAQPFRSAQRSALAGIDRVGREQAASFIDQFNISTQLERSVQTQQEILNALNRIANQGAVSGTNPLVVN